MRKNTEEQKQKIVIVVILAIITVVVGLIVINNQLNNKKHKVPQTPKLYTVPEKEKVIIKGEVKPTRAEEFFIDKNEKLENIDVENGKVVEKGSVLFKCRDKSIQSKIDLLRDYIEINKINETKIDEGTNETKIDEGTNENKDENLLNEINKIESDALTSVVAPFTGKVYIDEPVSNKNSFNPLMKLSSLDMNVEGLVTEDDLNKVTLNQVVDITINSNGEQFKGKISFIDNYPSKITKDKNENVSKYIIKIDFLENQDLSKIRDGFHAKVKMEAINSKIKVPYSALIQEDEKKYVYKVIDGVVYKQEVKTSEVNDNYAIVSEGVGVNDKIIKYAKSYSIKNGDVIGYDKNVKNEK